MIMAMDYVDGTPSDYQAPRFHQGDEHASRLINLGHLNENRVMNTGFHRYAWKSPSKTQLYYLPGEVSQLAGIYQEYTGNRPKLVKTILMVMLTQTVSFVMYATPTKMRTLDNPRHFRSLGEDIHSQRP
jgi:hypothetical protein